MAVTKPKHSAKGGTQTSMRRSAHNKATGKYERQRARTSANKARRMERLASRRGR